jgi:hypothetical protein
MARMRWYGFGGLALLAGVLLAWVPAGMEGADREEKPADLEAVPADGGMLMCFGVADLWGHALVKPLREKLGKEAGEAAAAMEKQFGAPPEQIERLTLLLTTIGPNSEMILVGLNKPYDKAKVAGLAGEGGQEEAFKGRTLFVNPMRGPSVGLLGPRAYAIGNADAIRSLLEQAAAKRDGPLAEARRLAGGKHALVAGLNVPALATQLPGLPGEVEALQPLLEAKSATLTADLATESRADLRLTFAGAAEARKGARALREGVKLAMGAVAEGKTGLAKSPDRAALVPLLDQVLGLLEDVAVEQDGAAVRAATKAKIDVAALVPLLVEAVQKQRGAAGRAPSQNNLRQIALATINYADTYQGRLPPQALFSKDGKPLLSWRVLILPFIGENELYKEFHLDEPWDSEHNKKLLAKMPRTYAISGQKDPTATHYQGFHGKGAFFEGKKGVRFPADFTDGTSNTLMIVEAARAVPWTKPEDLPYDPDKPLPKLGGLFPGGFNGAMCDGSVRFFSAAIKPTTLHLLIQRNDGQPLPADF